MHRVAYNLLIELRTYMCIKHIYYWRIRTSQYFWIFLFLVETKLIVWLCDYFRKSIFRSIYWFIFAMIYISNISNLCPQLLTNWKSTRREGKGSTLTFSIRSKARQSKAKQGKAKQSKAKQNKTKHRTRCFDIFVEHSSLVTKFCITIYIEFHNAQQFQQYFTECPLILQFDVDEHARNTLYTP